MYAHVGKPGNGQARAVGAAMRHVRKRLGIRLRELAGASEADFVAGWCALVAEIEAGFRQEETVMETLRYPGLQPHRADNACTLAALHRITPQVEAGDTLLARQALLALADILSLHRLTAGLALAGRPARPGSMPGRFKAGFARRAQPDSRPLPHVRRHQYQHQR